MWLSMGGCDWVWLGVGGLVNCKLVKPVHINWGNTRTMVLLWWVADSKMKSANCVSLKCEPNNFLVTRCNSGNFRVLSYNSTSLWVASYGLIISLWAGSRISLNYIKSPLISLNYIKSPLSVYIISNLHVKQSKSNKVIWYPPESNLRFIVI